MPEVLSWDEFARNKGKLAFIAQDFETRKFITLLENNRQNTIKNYFYRYPRKVREQVKVVTVDMSGAYIPIIKQLFPKARIVLDRFHIVQHLGRAMMTTRIAIMKTFDKKSLPYRALKNHWRLFQKDSQKLSNNRFYSKTFRQTFNSQTNSVITTISTSSCSSIFKKNEQRFSLKSSRITWRLSLRPSKRFL